MSSNPLEDGIAALKAGDKVAAHRLLSIATGREPKNPRAWKMFYNAALNATEREHILARLQKIAPNDPQVLALLQDHPLPVENHNGILVVLAAVILLPALVWFLSALLR